MLFLQNLFLRNFEKFRENSQHFCRAKFPGLIINVGQFCIVNQKYPFIGWPTYESLILLPGGESEPGEDTNINEQLLHFLSTELAAGNIELPELASVDNELPELAPIDNELHELAVVDNELLELAAGDSHHFRLSSNDFSGGVSAAPAVDNVLPEEYLLDPQEFSNSTAPALHPQALNAPAVILQAVDSCHQPTSQATAAAAPGEWRATNPTFQITYGEFPVPVTVSLTTSPAVAEATADTSPPIYIMAYNEADLWSCPPRLSCAEAASSEDDGSLCLSPRCEEEVEPPTKRRRQENGAEENPAEVDYRRMREDNNRACREYRRRRKEQQRLAETELEAETKRNLRLRERLRLVEAERDKVRALLTGLLLGRKGASLRD